MLWKTEKQLVQTQWRSLRDALCTALEKIDGGRFQRKKWRRKQAGKTGDFGGGETALLHGKHIEKAGVHFSCVYGKLPKDFAKQIPHSADGSFWAGGISAIIHPANPFAPTAHLNLRMIATQKLWFGGGADLTPMLPQTRKATHADSKQFHAALKTACDSHNKNYYKKYKQACDDYFFLPHRNEPRGTGGLFIDNLNSGDWQADFAFLNGVGQAFLATYPAILAKRIGQNFTAQHRQQQLHQRGRYVEFNLLYDRGTLFGLRTGGNIESILSSLPPAVQW